MVWSKDTRKVSDNYSKDLRETVLHHFHDTIIGGHFGVLKTLEKVRGLYSYVEQYVKSCDVCARGKPSPRTKTAQYN